MIVESKIRGVLEKLSLSIIFDTWAHEIQKQLLDFKDTFSGMIKRKYQLTYIMTTSIQKEVNLQVKNKIESLSQENKTENYSAGLLH